MHMWRGFGCGVFNRMTWADPADSSSYCIEVDNSIALLKSAVRNWQLLTKSPSRIGRREPIVSKFHKETTELIMPTLKDVVGEYEKRGFPQPLPPFDHIKIVIWGYPFATFAGNTMYTNLGHSYDLLCMYDFEPGRFLWAWTVGKQT